MQNRPSEQSTQQYLQIKNEGLIYKVVQQEYQTKRLAVELSCILNIEVIILGLLLVIIEMAYNSLEEANFLPIFIEGAIFLLAILTLILFNRQYTSLYSIISISITLVYLITATILYAKQVPYQWLSALLFSIIIHNKVAAQIAVGAILFDKKKYMIIVALLGLQLILIALKAQAKIESTWLVVLIITVGTIISTLSIGLAFIFFSIAQKLKEFSTKFLGIQTLYIGLSQLGYSLIASLIFMKIQFKTPMVIICVPCAIFHFFMVIFTSYFKTEIVLFQADAIMIRKSQRRQYRVSLQKVEQENKLQKISSNFFVLKEKDALVYRPASLLEILQQPPSLEQCACVVCLTDKACFVWMPCGHLAVCDSCGNYLMNSDKLDCIICKSKCQQIYHLNNKPIRIEQLDYKSDFYFKINQK